MEWLNYHHLLYFWVVAREGSITQAGEVLGLTQPTVSGQLRELETSLGQKLLERNGRRLALTETGRVVFAYAEQIFKLGQELQAAVKGRPGVGPVRLTAGAVDALPTMLVHRLLQPVHQPDASVRIVCREGKLAGLLADLAVRRLDVVLSDAPAGRAFNVKVHNHLLGECGLSFFATAKLARTYGGDFPRSLHHAPVLLPTEGTAIRLALEQWLRSHDLSPQVRGEFEDGALLKLFGSAGEGVFAMPSVIEAEVCRWHSVQVIGRVDGLRMRCYAITADRKPSPVVAALAEAARQELFSGGTV